MIKTLYLPLSLAIASLSFNAMAVPNSMQQKAYATGEAIEKPMQMTSFVELQYAREVSDLSFNDLQGKAHKLSDYHGKLLLLNLWATWCPPCIREIPALQKVKAHNQNSNISVVSLSIDEDPKDISTFLQKHQFEGFSTLIDPNKQIEKIMPANVVPATYVFDGAGNLVGFMRGFLHWDEPSVQPYLDKLSAKYAGKKA